ncbi:MAG TPA: gluconate 2-dehydrogenase subunit 3 family protein [Acidimicrobiales bacterium]|jgi:hypothetical protein|nr:gluconate 2-dehydrogenase subunit 3 family protein [Acidimicrobiales bacterium]
MGKTPGSAEPRFPGFDVTEQSPHWDATTTAVVFRRLQPAGTPVFFDGAEEGAVRALLDRLLAQDDEPRVDVFAVIDQRLAQRRGDGYRYADLPDDPEAWRQSIAGLEADAMLQFGRDFSSLAKQQQINLIETVRTHEGQWRGLPAKRVFSLWMRYACDAFYAHPLVWNEIGFGGPAYPRGYKNIGLDRREPWEVAENDAEDPVPWSSRADAAKRHHSGHLSPSASGGRAG